MSAYTQITYQVVFRTKWSKRALLKEKREFLYNYIAGVIRNKKCFCYAVGGVEDHIHIVLSLHPTVALADLIKDIKLSSGKLIKDNFMFPEFQGWANKYSAFTYTVESRENLVAYLENQEQHHSKKTYAEELRELLQEHKVEIDERYFDLD